MDRMGSESVRVRSSLETFRAAHQSLPEGKDKSNMNVKIKRLELRQAQLEKNAYTYNVAALLVKEMKYNGLDSQVSVLEHYIAAVEQKKMALTEAAVRASQVATFPRQPVVSFLRFQDLFQARSQQVVQTDDPQQHTIGERPADRENYIAVDKASGIRDWESLNFEL